MMKHVFFFLTSLLLLTSCTPDGVEQNLNLEPETPSLNLVKSIPIQNQAILFETGNNLQIPDCECVAKGPIGYDHFIFSDGGMVRDDEIIGSGAIDFDSNGDIVGTDDCSLLQVAGNVSCFIREDPPEMNHWPGFVAIALTKLAWCLETEEDWNPDGYGNDDPEYYGMLSGCINSGGNGAGN